MNFYFVLSLFVLFLVEIKAKINVDELRCLVCHTSIYELTKQVKKIDPSKTVDVGGYRLDKDGNMQQKTVSQAKSEIHLSELIDNVCEKMDDYVRATWKSNGELTLLKLMTDDGKMNNQMSEVDIIQDDDLNKSLKYYCETIMEEHEENIIKHYLKDTKDINKSVCVEETSICKDTVRTNEEL